MSDDSRPLTVEVFSREEAGSVLSSDSSRKDVCFLVSIGEVDNPRPAGYANITEKLRLHFSDTTDEAGPSEEDVKSLIAAAEQLSQRSGRVVVHCEAGISRSSAAAVIIYAVLLGPGSEQKAVSRVLQQRPIARPNRRMVAFADRLLERKGALMAAVDQVVGRY